MNGIEIIVPGVVPQPEEKTLPGICKNCGCQFTAVKSLWTKRTAEDPGHYKPYSEWWEIQCPQKGCRSTVTHHTV